MSHTAAAALSLETVLYEKKGAFAYITMNRPKVLNALNKQALADFASGIRGRQSRSRNPHGAIITGAGEKAFIAGADINEVATDTPVEAEQKTRHGQAVMDLIENLGKPVIAAVNGFALGGGCRDLPLLAPFASRLENARFGLPEVKARNHSWLRRDAGGFPAL